MAQTFLRLRREPSDVRGYEYEKTIQETVLVSRDVLSCDRRRIECDGRG